MRVALFLDRDGIINRMVNHYGVFDSPQKPEEVKLLPNITSIIGWANKRNIEVVEISNQPGAAKGKMSKNTQLSIENAIHKLLSKKNVRVDEIYICPHHPQGIIKDLSINCNCRKPKPGLILKAARELKIDLSKSIFLGDKSTDVEAGKAAGVKTIIYLHAEDEEKKINDAQKAKSDYSTSKLKDVIPILRKHFGLN